MDAGGVGGAGDGCFEKMETEEERTELLRDRFRLSVISIADAEGLSLSPLHFLLFSSHRSPSTYLITRHDCAAKKLGMQVAEPVVACIADLAFKFTGGR